MTASAGLDGYDLIYSVRLHAVASQFVTLYRLGVLPTYWNEELSDKSASISAQLGIPTLSASLNTAGQPLLSMSVPITAGTFSYLSNGAKAQVHLPNSTLVFTSQLRLGTLAKYKTSPKVEQQLKQIDSIGVGIESNKSASEEGGGPRLSALEGVCGAINFGLSVLLLVLEESEGTTDTPNNVVKFLQNLCGSLQQIGAIPAVVPSARAKLAAEVMIYGGGFGQAAFNFMRALADLQDNRLHQTY